MVRALAYTGVAIVTNLLPHETETTLRTNDTLLWLKVLELLMYFKCLLLKA